MVENKILEFELELRLWVESRMREPITNKEILILFEKEFPWKKGLTVAAIGAYRKRFIPEYKGLILERFGKKASSPQKEIEEEILAEVSEAEAEKEEFSVEEQKKLNQIKAHRKVLAELWKNYLGVRDSKEETPKGRYLELMSKELEKLGELEASEKSFLSAMEEVKKAEAKITIEQYLDSMQGWFVPRMAERAKDGGQAIEYVFRLQMFLQGYSQLLLEHPVEEANRILLEKLYASKKIKKEE